MSKKNKKDVDVSYIWIDELVAKHEQLKELRRLVKIIRKSNKTIDKCNEWTDEYAAAHDDRLLALEECWKILKGIK